MIYRLLVCFTQLVKNETSYVRISLLKEVLWFSMFLKCALIKVALKVSSNTIVFSTNFAMPKNLLYSLQSKTTNQ